MTIKTAEELSGAKRAQWLHTVEKLMSDVTEWAKLEGWPFHRDSKSITESQLGEYHAPIVRIRTPNSEVYIEPIAFDVVGRKGRIDIQAWPSLNRVMLLKMGETWQIMTESGVPLPSQWGKESFVQLVKDLTAAP